MRNESGIYRKLMVETTALKKKQSLVQRLRVCLPMQGTWVQSLVQEDSTCRGATKPVGHDY